MDYQFFFGNVVRCGTDGHAGNCFRSSEQLFSSREQDGGGD